MATTTGVVRDVDEVKLGSHLLVDAAAGTNVLTVDTAAPFSPTGGTVDLDGTATAYTTADAAAGTVTLADNLTATLEAGFPVWQMLDDQIEVTYWATVDPDDPDAGAVLAFVPTTVRGWLSPDRDYTTPVPVTLQLGTGGNAGRWEVVDPHQASTFDSPVRASDDEGTIGGLNEYGDVIARNLSYQGDLIAGADTLLIDGASLSTFVKRFPRGIEARAAYTPAVSGITTSYGLMELAWTPPADYEDRSYGLSFAQEMSTSAADTTVAMRVRLTTDGTAPTATGTQVLLARQTHRVAGLQGQLIHEHVLEFAPTTGDLHRFLLTADVTAPSGATASTVGAGRFEVVDRGPKMPNQAVKNSGGGTLATGGTDTGATPVVEKKIYTLTYPAIATHWWEGGNLTDNRASDNQYVGYLAGEGNRRSAIWFDYAKIAADLAGANVLDAELRSFNVWEGGNNKTLVFGSHSDAVVRSSWNAITGKVEDRTRRSGVNEGTIVNPPIELAWGSTALQGWATGAIKGLLVGPGPTNDFMFRFSYRGAGHKNRPVLALTFER